MIFQIKFSGHLLTFALVAAHICVTIICSSSEAKMCCTQTSRNSLGNENYFDTNGLNTQNLVSLGDKSSQSN